MRIGVAVGWPFRYTTCWVELGSSESESDRIFFFLIALSSEVIANSFTERFEDMLRWLYKTDKANRDTCKHWRAWSREKFVKHLCLLYPQLSNAADKSYLEMMKDTPFQYDLDNPVVELKSQSELSKIVKHYDSLTIAAEAEAVNILMGKINIPNVYNWIPIFNEMATGCDAPIPVTTACGHPIENGNPIIDIRDVDFPQ